MHDAAELMLAAPDSKSRGINVRRSVLESVRSHADSPRDMDSNMLHRLLLILSLFNVTVWACDDNDGTAEYEKIMERQLYPEMDGLNYPYNDYSWFKPNYPTASRFSGKK